MDRSGLCSFCLLVCLSVCQNFDIGHSFLRVSELPSSFTCVVLVVRNFFGVKVTCQGQISRSHFPISGPYLALLFHKHRLLKAIFLMVTKTWDGFMDGYNSL